MKKQPPRWFLAICGIGFILTLVLEVVSFSRLPHATAENLGGLIGTDFIGALCWLLPVALWDAFPARWMRWLTTAASLIVAVLISWINLRALM